MKEKKKTRASAHRAVHDIAFPWMKLPDIWPQKICSAMALTSPHTSRHHQRAWSSQVLIPEEQPRVTKKGISAHQATNSNKGIMWSRASFGADYKKLFAD